MVRVGGRIKAARIGLEELYPETYHRYTADPTPENALLLYTELKELRQQPPRKLLDAFFPHPPERIKQFLNGTGMYRPILKTDQGPAGNFFCFRIASQSEDTTYDIATTQGLAVPEIHFTEKYGSDAHVKEMLKRMIDTYRDNDLIKCNDFLMNLEAQLGTLSREATVGRGPFFFCQPTTTTKPITISEDLVQKIETSASALVNAYERKAYDARRRFREGASLPTAITGAREADISPPLMYYCQPDVFIDRDGDYTISSINMPDVMMFLTQLTSSGNTVFSAIQEVAHALSSRILTHLNTLLPHQVYVLTRDEVCMHKEDSLELLEIKALGDYLSSHGHSVRVIASSDIPHISNGSHVLMMNVPIYDGRYHALLHRVAHDEIVCMPDPFLKAFEKQMTQLYRRTISGKQLELFLEAIKPGRVVSATALFERHKDIEAIYRIGGFKDDVLYFDVPGERTVVPTIKHSVHSFYALYNVCKKHNFPPLSGSDIPINRSNATLLGSDGGRIAAYRFLMIAP